MWRPPRAAQKFFGKNTIDLQWKMHANYNVRPCDGERKAALLGTMANNGKNNAKNNGNRRTSGHVLTRRLVIDTPQKQIARRRKAPGAHRQD
jgi:hypothetical protein